MKRRKCANKICDNLSRSFEGRFCCIECADYYDGIIDIQEYLSCIEYYQNPKLSHKHGSRRWT